MNTRRVFPWVTTSRKVYNAGHMSTKRPESAPGPRLRAVSERRDPETKRKVIVEDELVSVRDASEWNGAFDQNMFAIEQAAKFLDLQDEIQAIQQERFE